MSILAALNQTFAELGQDFGWVCTNSAFFPCNSNKTAKTKRWPPMFLFQRAFKWANSGRLQRAGSGHARLPQRVPPRHDAPSRILLGQGDETTPTRSSEAWHETPTSLCHEARNEAALQVGSINSLLLTFFNQWWLKMFVESFPHKQSSFESVGFNSVPGPLCLTGYTRQWLCVFLV